MQRIYFLLLSAILSIVCTPPIWASGTVTANNSNDASAATDANVSKQVYQDTNPNGANYLDRRHALVGHNCMVNRLNTTVSVGSGTAHLENLVNKNLDDGVTFISGVNAQLITEPTYTIRDVKHVYEKGTTAGFVVTLDNSVLKVTAVDVPMKIFFYKDGKSVGTVSCEQKQGSLLNLQLASYSKNTLEFTATAPNDFDEIGLGSAQLLKADVVGAMTVKYAFVGKNGKYFIDKEATNGIEDFKEAVKKAYPGTTFDNDELVLGQCITDLQKTPDETGKTIDEDPDNFVDIKTSVLGSVPTPVTVSAYGGAKAENLPFKKGMTVGFETAGTGILDVGSSIKLYPYIMTPSNNTSWFSSPWNWQEAPKGSNDGDFTLLGVDLGGGRKDIITTLTEDCNAVELKAVSLLGVGVTVAYRMFVVLPPSIDPDDPLQVSAAQAICEDTKTVTLKSNRPVTWACKEAPNEKAKEDIKMDPDTDGLSCQVSGFKYAGKYTFEATDKETGSTRTTTITYGVQRLYDTATMPWVNNFTEPDVTYHVMSEKEMKKEYENSVAANISDRKNTDNLVNGSIDDYMSYGANANIGSYVVACVKRSEALHLTKPTRVGFVLRMQDTYLDVKLLESMKVVAYNSGKKCTEITRDHNFKVLQASIAGQSNMQNTEFNVELAGNQDVDELMLCVNSALDINLSDIRVYYAFSEAEDDANNFETQQNNEGEIVSYNDGARIDESLMGGYQNLAAIASLKNNYTNFIDGNMTDYLSVTNTVEAASGANIIPVKLGKIYSGNHLVQVNMGKVTGLADVDVADVVKIYAYLNGEERASKTTWNAVDANVIKAGGDFTLRWTPGTDFDEIVIQEYAVAKLLNTEEKFYGMRIYSDADGDGIPDYEDDESCPNVAFLLDENEPKLDKIHDFTNSKMFLHRTFARGKWTTICLPVDLTYNQFAATFGSDAQLAEPRPFREDTPNRVQFDIIDKVYGNNVLLQKNKPYIIKVNSLGNEKIDTKFAADNATEVSLADEKTNNLAQLNDQLAKTNTSAQEGSCYQFKGISYSTTDENGKDNFETSSFDHTTNAVWPMTKIEWHCTFVCPQKIGADFYSFRLTPQDQNADAEMDHVTEAIDYFRGLRCWMTADGKIAQGVGAKQLTLAVGDQVISSRTTTGISDVKSHTLSAGNIYTLTGVLVRRSATSTDGLSKGIYIWNNKKIEVK